MKKIFLLIILVIFFILISLNIYKLRNNKEIVNENNVENTQTDTLYNFKYFNLINSNTDFDYSNDMSFMNSIYYKVITDYQEYSKYKEIYDITDMNDNDFENYFLVLTITENESTKNLILESVNSDEDTLYIGLDKNNPDEDENLPNKISIKIDKRLLRNNIEVFKTIQNTNFMTNYSDIKELPKDYSIEEAISDNCFVLTTNPATNINLLEDFLNNVQNKQDSELRIVGNEISDSIIIYDVKYVAANKKYYVCVDTSRGSSSNLYNYFEYDAFTKIENNDSNIIMNSEKISIFEFSNINFPETNLKFSFYNSYDSIVY
jgi:hypothetical protein